MSMYNVGDRVLANAPHNSAQLLEVEITKVIITDRIYRAGKRELRHEEIHGFAPGYTRPPETERARILVETEALINGDRAKDYGDPNENFGRIANLWNAQFAHKLNQPFTAQDVAYALIHLKMSRLANTPGHRDSLIDVCGYAALSGELK